MDRIINIEYLECSVRKDSARRIIYMDSYFTKRVTRVNVSLLLYPYDIISKYVIEEPSVEGIIIKGDSDCRSLLEYVVETYYDLKSEGFKLFKRMYLYNVSNLLIPLSLSPSARDRWNRYEKIVGEFSASAMLLERILGKEVLRGKYDVRDNGRKYVRLKVSRINGNMVFSNGILGKMYTRLYENDELFRRELDKILDFKPP